jgi:ferredoxin-thioredoxin reductase catalytic chain
MNVEQLYEVLKKAQEAQGFFFNKDQQRVFFLLQGLLTNKERYGYMCCPCRLAAEDRQQDQDIICPCAYRAPDVAEFGSCYCNLYVSGTPPPGKELSPMRFAPPPPGPPRRLSPPPT